MRKWDNLRKYCYIWILPRQRSLYPNKNNNKTKDEPVWIKRILARENSKRTVFSEKVWKTEMIHTLVHFFFNMNMNWTPFNFLVNFPSLGLFTVHIGKYWQFLAHYKIQILFKFGPKKVDFFEILAPFLVNFQIFALNYHFF